MKRRFSSIIILLGISLCLFMTACDSEFYQNGDITFALTDAIDMPVQVYVDGSEFATIPAGSKSVTLNILATTFKAESIVFKTTYAGTFEGVEEAKSCEIGYIVGYDVNLPVRGTAAVTMAIADSMLLDSYTVTYIDPTTSPADNESEEGVDSSYYSITAFNGSGDTVIIPSTISGEAVSVPASQAETADTSSFSTSVIKNLYISYGVSLGNGAFAGNKNIEKVSISSANIGNRAFENCTGINSVVFTGPVESIGDYAFYGCTNLTNLEFNSTVASIGDRAFSFDPINTELTLNGIQSIGEYAFSIMPDEDQSRTHSLTGVLTINALDSVTIGPSAFRVTSDKPSTISKIVINGNADIGKNAFLYLSEESVLINGNVSSIGCAAFAGSSKLSDFEIRGSLDNFYNNNEYGDYYPIFGSTPLVEKGFFSTIAGNYIIASDGKLVGLEQSSSTN